MTELAHPKLGSRHARPGSAGQTVGTRVDVHNIAIIDEYWTNETYLIYRDRNAGFFSSGHVPRGRVDKEVALMPFPPPTLLRN